MTKPYTDISVNGTELIRQFSQEIDPIELMWHRDDEDRLVESVDPTDWKIQLDDRLPVSLARQVKISRHEWHRLIKGSGSVTLKITKIENK